MERWERRFAILGMISESMILPFTCTLDSPAPPPATLKRPHIIVFNHTSTFDVILGYVLFRRWRQSARFVVQSRFLSHPVLGFLLPRTGCIFVDSSLPRSHSATRQALDRLQRGGHLVIAPEGRLATAEERASTHRTAPFEEGVGLLARRSGAPILAMGIDNVAAVSGQGRAMPTLRIGVRRPKVTIRMEELGTASEIGGSRAELVAWMRDSVRRLL